MATATIEKLTLVVIWPLSLAIYQLLKYNWPNTTVPALALPIILFEFLGLFFLVIIPCQYLTAARLTAELTGITVLGWLQDVPDLRKCHLSPLPFHL